MSSFGFSLQHNGMERETLHNPPLNQSIPDIFTNTLTNIPLPTTFSANSIVDTFPMDLAVPPDSIGFAPTALFLVESVRLFCPTTFAASDTLFVPDSGSLQIQTATASSEVQQGDLESNALTITDLLTNAPEMLPNVPSLNAGAHAAGSASSQHRSSQQRASNKENQPPHPRLTKEARRIAGVRQREASAAYTKDLDKAWETIDEAVGQIAKTHHKSVRRVQVALHMGRMELTSKHQKPSAWHAFLREVSQESESSGRNTLINNTKQYVDAYWNLTHAERNELQQLAAELLEEKTTKVVARQPSNRSKVNDITFTIQKVETELNNLQSRTGCESLLFAVRGATNMGLRGISFATQSVENSLPGTMMIDPQHFMSKLEGHAIQGLKGSGKNHAQQVRETRSCIRKIMQDKLAEIVGDTNVVMRWKFYWRDIIMKHHVKVEGWPESIPFKNLSDGVGTLHVLKSLLTLWETGETYWHQLTNAEFQELEKEHEQAIADGTEQEPGPRQQRSDKGKKRASGAQPAGHQNKRARQNAPSGSDNARIEAIHEAEPAPEPLSTHSGEPTVDLSPGTTFPAPDMQFTHTDAGPAEVGEGLDFGEDFDYELFDAVLEQIQQEGLWQTDTGRLDCPESSSTSVLE